MIKGKLTDDNMAQVTGGKIVNAVWEDSMRKQIDTDLGEAERHIDRSRLFMKLDEKERNTNGKTKITGRSMSC